MAPGSVSSETASSSSSSSSVAGLSGSPGCGKAGVIHNGVLLGRRNPTMLRMVLEALQAGEQRRGTSVVAIKLYILQKYPTVDITRFKYLLKQALDTGMRRGLLARPANSKAKGATGSFKLVPKRKKIKPRKTLTLAASKTAKGKGPKEPREPKADPTGASAGPEAKAAQKPGEARKAPPRPRAAREKAPARGSEARGGKARSGESGKAPPKPDKAARAPAGAHGLCGKAKVKDGGSRQGAVEAHRKAKVKGERSKPQASKVQTGAASPKKKRAVGVPTGTAVRGAGAGPRPKAQPGLMARKTEAPEGPRKPGLPAKPPSAKVSGKKAEARS